MERQRPETGADGTNDGLLQSSRRQFGSFLRTSRTAREMSLDEIARVTRIPMRSLQHIEGGRFESLPADVFVRGFLRSYAQCIGLDADDIIRRYASCGLTPAPVASPQAEALLQSMRSLAPASAAASSARVTTALPAAGEPRCLVLRDEAGPSGPESDARAESAIEPEVVEPEVVEVVEPEAVVIEAVEPAAVAVAVAVAVEAVEPETTASAVTEAADRAVELAAAAPAATAAIAVEPAAQGPARQHAGKRGKKRRNKKRRAAQAGPAATKELRATPAVAEPSATVEQAPAVEASAKDDKGLVLPPPSVQLVSAEVTSAEVVERAAAGAAIDAMRDDEPSAATEPPPALAAGEETPGGRPASLRVSPSIAAAVSASHADGAGALAAPPSLVTAPSLVIDDDDPESAERERDGRADKEPTWRAFIPPVLLDPEDQGHRGALTLAVIILVIVATITMTYLLRRPSTGGDGVTQLDRSAQPRSA